MEPIIPEGFIILARKVRKSPLWKSLKATHRIVMIELLLQAQYKDGEVVRNGEILYLKRGQIATSYQHLVDDIGDKDIKVKVVRNAIEKLVKHDFLAKDGAKARAKKGLLLTVVNYGIYQDTENYKVKAKGKEKGITGAKDGQSRGKAGAISNKVNKDKNVNKELINNIYLHWNSKKIINHKTLSQKRTSAINARLEDGYRSEEIINAIDNYSSVLSSKAHYYSHKFNIEDFMNPKNIDKFLDENDPFSALLKHKNKGGSHERTTNNSEQFNPDELSL